MKKLYTLIGILILTFILNCVAFNQALAAESTWYEEAAERAGNPVLLETEEYFQGVTLKSHVISDLTFMEINFEDYTEMKADKIQIITFAEASYMQDEERYTETVMYVYFPNGVGLDHTRIWVDFEFTSRKQYINNINYDSLSDEDKDTTYNTKWEAVSQYDTIVKFSSGLYQKVSYKKEVNEWLLNKEDKESELQTIFDTKITKYQYYSNVLNKYENVYFEKDSFYIKQSFQFISLKREDSRTSACLNYNFDTVSVVGETKRYRYRTDYITDYKFIDNVYDTEYTDLYYFYFNVFDDKTGEKWKDKYISRVKLNYLSVLVTEKNKTEQLMTNINSVLRTWDVKCDLLDKNGNVVVSKEYKKENFGELSSNMLKEFVEENKGLVENYITKTITPEEKTVNYLPNSLNNTLVADFVGLFNTRDFTYLTLFSTTSDEFKSYIEDSEYGYDRETISKYQYGLVYEDSKVELNTRNWVEGFVINLESTETYFHNELISLLEIETVENGVVYTYKVSDSVIDNSDIYLPPENPGHAPGSDNEGDPKPKGDAGIWKWLQDIINFFTITLPAWFEENKNVVIGVVVVIVIIIAIIFITNLIRNLRTEIMINKLSRQQKEQELKNLQEQEQPKNKKKKE